MRDTRDRGFPRVRRISKSLLLVSPIQGETGLMELVRIEAEIKKLIKVPVDVVLDTTIPEQHRDKINREAVKI